MKGTKKHKTTIGTIAVALFWTVIVSGILIAIPFDVHDPYLNISEILIGNPFASLVRNAHYWSSQFFLVMSLLHIYDHFHYRKKIGIKKGKAIRLSIGALVIFLAMLTGFLLRGDADSVNARQVLETLVIRIPIIGKSLAFTLLGAEGDYQLIYVHHIATFTIFLVVVMVEHSRRFWPTAQEFLAVLIITVGLSYLANAPLHDNISPTVKGPWYFTGFQEILHWMRYPAWSLLFLLVLILMVYLVNAGKQKTSWISKKSLLVFTIFYIVLTLIGMFFRGEQWKWIFPWQTGYSESVLISYKISGVGFTDEFTSDKVANSPVIEGRRESCLVCHTQTYGFTAAHDPGTIGCYSCHRGNPFATQKKQAHRNMHQIPGNLSNASVTCGTTDCHPEIVERVPTGLMATLSGMISVDRTVFKEQDDPDLITHVHHLGQTAADEHLRNLCVKCHLGNPKTTYGPVQEWSRGGGCLACHLNYSEKAEKALMQSKSLFVRAHPSVSLNVSNQHCFGCHNRSGRIATNYEGWHETTLRKEEMPDTVNFRLIEGRRVFEKQPADAHHLLGMECIDCHHSYELMGDGNSYAHEEDQEDVQCEDCHFKNEPLVVETEDLDNESALIASMRFGNIENRKFLQTGKFNHALTNTFVRNDSTFLMGKNSGKLFLLSRPAEECTNTTVHSNITCSGCHSSWVSSCIDCHNEYDNDAFGYDLYENKEVIGTWTEKSGSFSAELPTLGIRKTVEGNKIVPTTPGMVLTINKRGHSGNDNDSTIFQRLFAQVAPHTTSKKGRNCKSCHNNPIALGLGKGELEYLTQGDNGKWTFNPREDNHPVDGLPRDAWTGFMTNRTGMVSTRKNVFPLDPELQKKILTVGSCLTCHEENSPVMRSSLNNYEEVLLKLSSKCILPTWD